MYVTICYNMRFGFTKTICCTFPTHMISHTHGFTKAGLSVQNVCRTHKDYIRKFSHMVDTQSLPAEKVCVCVVNELCVSTDTYTRVFVCPVTLCVQRCVSTRNISKTIL